VEKETLMSVVNDVEKAIKPLGFKIDNFERRHVAGPFSWDVGPGSSMSRAELHLTLSYVIETSKKETLAGIACELEKVIMPLAFEIMSFEKHYIGTQVPPFIDTEQSNLEVTIIREGELG
jgi:hypothetical protein